jgi:hypothetical protein
MLEHDVSADEANAFEEHVLASFVIALGLGFLVSFEEEVVRFKRLVNDLDIVVNPHRHKGKADNDDKIES